MPSKFWNVSQLIFKTVITIQTNGTSLLCLYTGRANALSVLHQCKLLQTCGKACSNSTEFSGNSGKAILPTPDLDGENNEAGNGCYNQHRNRRRTERGVTMLERAGLAAVVRVVSYRHSWVRFIGTRQPGLAPAI